MYKAQLLYDGTHYFGWQKTLAGPSIQQALQDAIFRIVSENVLPEAASRTDRGVHARGQVVQFALKQTIDPKTLQKSLNAVLPASIRISHLSLLDFHPTLDAIGKEYHYHLSLVPVQLPMDRFYAWHIHRPLCKDSMLLAAKFLTGIHDFSAFANEKEKNPICTVDFIKIFSDYISIKGDRFLYKMVRNLVGAIIYAGLGKISPENIPNILASRDRKKAAVTAPAHGLYLHQVFYPAKLSP